MDYRELEEFIHNTRKMRMTHIYQPILIKTLLESKDGSASVDEIARKFLDNDDSQINYYKKVAKRWPKITLKSHGVIKYKKDIFTLNLDHKLSPDERKHLIELCDLRLNAFIDEDPWIKKIRETDKTMINKSVRFDILARSKGICVACGVKSTEAMLHVDHIVPVSLGGKTEPGNLQALCYKCNTQKRNKDETDFLLHHNRLKFRKTKCPLCKENEGMLSNSMAHTALSKDLHEGIHTLVIPNRHAGSFIDLLPAERQLCLNLVDDVINNMKNDGTAKEFNVTGFDRARDHFYIDVVPLPTPRQRG